jgi:Flp pilus assembly protein TadD
MEIENHQPELALLDIDKAIELEPDNGKFFLSRGYLYADMGKKKLAYLDFEKAISLGIPRYSLETELKKLK